MKYLMDFFDNELCPEKRVSAEKYAQFLEYFQRSISINPARLVGGSTCQSEMTLLYCALDHRYDSGENISVAEAAKQLDVSVPFVSKTLKNLTEKGYVERLSDENDRRCTRISVTPGGEALVNKFFIKVFSVLNTAMSDFTQDEIESMIDLYGRIINAVTNAAENASNRAEVTNDEH